MALIERYRKTVNMVFQNYALFPHLTVAQNIALGLEMLNRRKGEIKRAVAEPHGCQSTGQTNAGGTLDVIIEGIHPVTVIFQQPESILVAEIPEPD